MPPQSPPLLRIFCCSLLLAICIGFGGGTRNREVGDAIAAAVCFPAGVFSLVEFFAGPRTRQEMISVGILGLVLLLPALQLVPLPPAVWTALPGRAEVVNGFQIAGITPPWLGVSLSPITTRQSTLSLIPPAAIFLVTLRLDPLERRGVVRAVIGIGALCVFLGVAQSLAGPDPLLRFYYPEDIDIVGPFANRNHFAALVYCLLIVSMGWLAGTWQKAMESRGGRPASGWARLEFSIAFGSVALFLFGLVFIQSRAGWALGALAFAFGAILFYSTARAARAAGALGVVTAAMLLFVIILANYFYSFVTERLQIGSADTFRPEIALQTKALASKYFPFGSGFGTFLQIFAAHEIPGQAFPAVVNRAHNDYLEWLLEGGMAAAALLLVALAWFAWINLLAWRDAQGMIDSTLARACGLAPILLLLHSIVDYPLRTVAMMSVAAFCAAMCLKAPASRRKATRRSLPAAELLQANTRSRAGAMDAAR